MISSEIKDKMISWGKSLSFKEIIILILLATTAVSAWSSSHYKDKATQLRVSLESAKITLRIERDNAKLNDNSKELARLTTKLEKKNDEIQNLYIELDRIKSTPNTRTKVMEELGDLNDTEDICKAFAKHGYYICD